MTIAIYLRISQDRLGLELGVDRQREDCEALCRARGWTNPRVFSDNDKSAMKGKPRPDYKALMQAVDRGEVTKIVVWHTSRIWRNRRERVDGIERLAAVRGALVPVKGTELDLSTASGRVLAGVLGEFDSYESELKAERGERENLQRAQQGRQHGGPKPYGYGPVVGTREVRNPRTGEVIIKERRDYDIVIREEADEIRDWVRAMLAGRSITSLSKQTGRPIPVLRGIIGNPRNAGLRVLNGVEYKGKWPAIIDVADWRTVRTLLDAPDRKRPAGHAARKWFGAGLYGCDRCDGRPVASAVNSMGKGTGKHYSAYKCVGGCSRSWKAEPIDAYIIKAITRRLEQPNVADLLPQHRTDVRELVEEKAEIKRKLGKLAAGWAADLMDDDQLAEAFGTLKARLGEVEGKLAEAQGSGVADWLLGHDDPAQAWLEIPEDQVGWRQQVARELVVIRLGAPPRGRAPFSWKEVLGNSRWVGDTRTWSELWT